MTSSHKSTAPSKPSHEQDAIEMLIADHKHVKGLFIAIDKLTDDRGAYDKKADLVKQVCDALTVHTQIEEEIFYPAVRKAIDDGALMDEALVEHAGAKQLIAQLEAMEPGDDLYDARVTVLREQIEHHVKEEEGEMFPDAKKAKVDTLALGTLMAKRKSTLMAAIESADGKGHHATKAKVVGMR
jgi:hemerythrin superfamily protein